MRQLDLAEALDLSPSAVCQMLSGKISPNLKQLDVIMAKLSLDRSECAELRDCLSRIRSGDEELRSPLNDFIRTSRTQRGLSIEQLAEMSAIPADTLMMLENSFNAQPTPTEAIRLAAIFDCNVSELWQVVPGMETENPVSYNTSSQDNQMPGGVTMFRDGATPFCGGAQPAEVKIPVVKIEDLLRFDARCDKLVEFSWRHMVGFDKANKFGVVIVKAPGKDFGWSDYYDALIEVVDKREWIPGMSLLAWVDGEVILGRAAEEQYCFVPLGDDEVMECQWYAMVSGFRFESNLLELVSKRQNEREKRTRRTAIGQIRSKKSPKDGQL